MTNVGKDSFFFFLSCCMHDRGLYQEYVILIAQRNISSDSLRNLIAILLVV